MSEKSVRTRIRGRVQGVWYRGWMVKQAQARGLSGWVRNRSDGSVEAVIAGPEELVDDLVRTLWEGPPAARVDNVEVQPAEEAPTGPFRQAPTV